MDIFIRPAAPSILLQEAESTSTTYIQHNYAIPQLSCHMPFLKFTPRILPSSKENGNNLV